MRQGTQSGRSCARAGADVWMAGNIGPDGRFLADLLHDAGTHTELIREGDMLTGTAFIQNEKSGDNCIIVSSMANHRVDEGQMDEVFEQFGSADLLLCQNEINHMEDILKRAREKGMTVVFNPAPMTDEIRQFDLSTIDLLIVNESELRALLGLDDPALSLSDLMDRGRTVCPSTRMIVTAGHKGAWYQDKEQRFFVPAFHVEAVDTTGAGDTFAGYVCALLARGDSIESAMKTASAAAALSVTKKGAASSIPSLEKTEEFLKNI